MLNKSTDNGDLDERQLMQMATLDKDGIGERAPATQEPSQTLKPLLFYKVGSSRMRIGQASWQFVNQLWTSPDSKIVARSSSAGSGSNGGHRQPAQAAHRVSWGSDGARCSDPRGAPGES